MRMVEEGIQPLLVGGSLFLRVVHQCSHSDGVCPQFDVADLPCQPGYNNCLVGGDCLNVGHYTDALDVN